MSEALNLAFNNLKNIFPIICFGLSIFVGIIIGYSSYFGFSFSYDFFTINNFFYVFDLQIWKIGYLFMILLLFQQMFVVLTGEPKDNEDKLIRIFTPFISILLFIIYVSAFVGHNIAEKKGDDNIFTKQKI